MGIFESQSSTLVTQMIEGSEKKIEKTGRMLNKHLMDQ